MNIIINHNNFPLVYFHIVSFCVIILSSLLCSYFCIIPAFVFFFFLTSWEGNRHDGSESCLYSAVSMSVSKWTPKHWFSWVLRLPSCLLKSCACRPCVPSGASTPCARSPNLFSSIATPMSSGHNPCARDPCPSWCFSNPSTSSSWQSQKSAFPVPAPSASPRDASSLFTVPSWNSFHRLFTPTAQDSSCVSPGRSWADLGERHLSCQVSE